MSETHDESSGRDVEADERTEQEPGDQQGGQYGAQEPDDDDGAGEGRAREGGARPER